MKIACLLTPQNQHNLKLASQIGVEEIVTTFPGTELSRLIELRDEVESHGMSLTTIERFIPHHKIVHQLPGYEAELDVFKQLIANMGDAGLKTLCYNWMPSEDWHRTSVNTPERGGALVTEFDLEQQTFVPHGSSASLDRDPTPAEKLWDTLHEFLEQVIPITEENNINLAVHPDDPPIEDIDGQAQILTTPDALEKVTQLLDSPRNGVCFCQGTFASRGDIDIPVAIEKLAPYIHFVHFRDVAGQLPKFRDTFHDNGKTDMAACWAAYENAQLDQVAIRPDHVPTMAGEDNEFPGYEMSGRLFAVGYMKGLRDAIISNRGQI